jgi:tetratricopeptide (TPR) repeat protein
MTQNNLGNVYSMRLQIDDHKASEAEQADYMQRAMNDHQQALQVNTPDLLPNACRQTAHSLGKLYADHHRWAEAITAYEQAIQATERLYQASIFRSSQEVELVATDNLFRRFAFALAQANDLQAAAVVLERGRACGLSETLERDRTDLTQLATRFPDRYQHYQTTVAALRQLETVERSASAATRSGRSPLFPESLRQRATQIRQDFQTAIASIRQLLGYKTFLTQPDFNDIVAALQLYLTTTLNGSLGLILQANPEDIFIDPIWQATFTETDLQTLLVGATDDTALDSWFRAYSNQEDDRKT